MHLEYLLIRFYSNRYGWYITASDMTAICYPPQAIFHNILASLQDLGPLSPPYLLLSILPRPHYPFPIHTGCY